MSIQTRTGFGNPQTLQQVMVGEADEDFVSQKVYQINHLTKYIETFPILSEEEQVKDILNLFG